MDALDNLHPTVRAILDKEGYEAKGAMPNGTRVRKTNSRAGDTHADGALATVLASMVSEPEIAYFVEWDSDPGFPVLIADSRLEATA